MVAGTVDANARNLNRIAEQKEAEMGKIHDALQRAEEQRARHTEKEGFSSAVASDPVHGRVRPSPAPMNQGHSRGGGVLIGAPGSALRNEFGTLRARIQSIRRTHPIRTLVVTSSREGEGKTTTAVNLALAFGMDPESNTCLVDADLRRPSVHLAFPQPPVAGLCEVLSGEAKLEEALLRVPDSRLSVLAVRSLPEQPSELLGSRAMSQLVAELHTQFDTVVIDAPPILGLADAVTLADLCDATLFVVGAGQVSREDVDLALERIDAEKLIGTVFNGCNDSEGA